MANTQHSGRVADGYLWRDAAYKVQVGIEYLTGYYIWPREGYKFEYLYSDLLDDQLKDKQKHKQNVGEDN